ncbi:MAG: tyrosine-type recombinase/integrase, partial [Deltaproteobacteria bacterium]|nr:tyrosine-type recombinase/integrase [Deltaproteobacteria bacterium]
MSKRRGRGEGSIYFDKEKGRYRGEISTGYSTEGKRQKRRVTAKTKRELQEKLEVIRAEINRGVVITPERMTLASFFGRWFDDCVHGSVRPSTEKRYRSIVKIHIAPLLGGTLLSKLTTFSLQSLYSTLKKQGASPRTCELVHVVLRRALSDAVVWRLIPSNPAVDATKPRVSKKEMVVWGENEARKFLASAKTDRLFAMYLLAISHGPRQGELFGLRWQDVDLQGGILHIHHNLQEDGKKRFLAEPKTQKGRRNIQLSKAVIEALKVHARPDAAQEGCHSAGN